MEYSCTTFLSSAEENLHRELFVHAVVNTDTMDAFIAITLRRRHIATVVMRDAL